MLYTVGRTPWTGISTSPERYYAQHSTDTECEHTQTSVPRAVFEPTTPAFEQAKTIHGLERGVTFIGEQTLRTINEASSLVSLVPII
jgi:hypothetical protein